MRERLHLSEKGYFNIYFITKQNYCRGIKQDYQDYHTFSFFNRIIMELYCRRKLLQKDENCKILLEKSIILKFYHRKKSLYNL